MESLHQRRHLDGFGAGAENEHYFFHPKAAFYAANLRKNLRSSDLYPKKEGACLPVLYPPPKQPSNSLPVFHFLDACTARAPYLYGSCSVQVRNTSRTGVQGMHYLPLISRQMQRGTSPPFPSCAGAARWFRRIYPRKCLTRRLIFATFVP